MPNLRNRFPARRRFLKQSAALTASASLVAPAVVLTQVRPQAAPVPASPANPPAAGSASTVVLPSPRRSSRD